MKSIQTIATLQFLIFVTLCYTLTFCEINQYSVEARFNLPISSCTKQHDNEWTTKLRKRRMISKMSSLIFESGTRTTSTSTTTMNCCFPTTLAMENMMTTLSTSSHSPCSSRRTRPLAFTGTELWTIRIASALTTYFGFVTVTDRPKGQLTTIASSSLEVRQSTVPGAGLGVFVTTPLRKDTILGTYPGVVIPLQQNLKKLQQYPQCEGYIWRFTDNQFVIDPTNNMGNIEEYCVGGNSSVPFSIFIFTTILASFVKVPTTLCRINEPPKGNDVNVITSEDLDSRTVTFALERDVYPGEELFIDYGMTYDRSGYSGL